MQPALIKIKGHTDEAEEKTVSQFSELLAAVIYVLTPSVSHYSIKDHDLS